MHQPLTKRFVQALGQSIWHHVADRIAEVAGFGAVLVRYVYINVPQLSWDSFKRTQAEGLALLVTWLAFEVLWHTGRAAYLVTRQIESEEAVARSNPATSRILSASGETLTTPYVPPYSRPRAKLSGAAAILTLAFVVPAYWLWTRVPRQLTSNTPILVTRFTVHPYQKGAPINIEVSLENRTNEAVRLKSFYYLSVKPSVTVPLNGVDPESVQKLLDVEETIWTEFQEETASRKKSVEEWPMMTIPAGKEVFVTDSGRFSDGDMNNLIAGTDMLFIMGELHIAGGDVIPYCVFRIPSQTDLTFCSNHN